jgi:1,4-alpha-glucan branching enzyme
MQAMGYATGSALHRYSAKRMQKPVNFFFYAPEAREVAVVGDFNDWQPGTHSMRRQPDGSWTTQVPLHHGHHLYAFLVDGRAVLDPRAQGIGRNARNERVSMMAVS